VIVTAFSLLLHRCSRKVSTVRGSGWVHLISKKHPFATANGTDLSQL